jgi:GAF domain-containing protein
MYVRPANEPERLKALHGFPYSSGKKIPALDHIAQVAIQHFKVPIALVSLVDETEQCFVGSQGVSLLTSPRNQAFCRYTIMSDEVLVVEDATIDERFATNPLVTGEPYIRFYAGAPLRLDDGIRLGTVCVVDHVPRQFTFGQKIVLRQLATIAMSELKVLRGL